MALYRARPEDGIAWVTGASTGIGRHVALELARKGYVVAATARDAQKLGEAAAQAAGAKGQLVPMPCDVTDEEAMARTVARIEEELGPIVLCLFNAGVSRPFTAERMETANFVSAFTVNVFGVVYGLVPVVRRMRERGRGQIAIVGSASAYFGMPSAAAYGATKAALNNMARGLKYDLDTLNIRIQMVNPGFVDTPLTKKNKFPMPALMPAGKAATRLVYGLERGGFEVTFPRRLIWFLKACSYLPENLYYRMVRKASGWDRRGPQRT